MNNDKTMSKTFHIRTTTCLITCRYLYKILHNLPNPFIFLWHNPPAHYHHGVNFKAYFLDEQRRGVFLFIHNLSKMSFRELGKGSDTHSDFALPIGDWRLPTGD